MCRRDKRLEYISSSSSEWSLVGSENLMNNRLSGLVVVGGGGVIGCSFNNCNMCGYIKRYI